MAPDQHLDQDASHGDLREGRPPWPAGTGEGFVAPRESLTCDVAIVGAGITGSLVAEHLSARGLDVVLIDREQASHGSTAASTAMLLWEIDRSLVELTGLYGFERAVRAYRLSLSAVAGLTGLVGALGLSCSFQPRSSLYLAPGDSQSHDILPEFALRRRAELPGHHLDFAALHGTFEIDRAGAILSPGSAEADPVALATGLADVAAKRRVRLVSGDARDFDATDREVHIGLADGHEIKAGHMVLATGYVMPDFVRSGLHQVTSTWAMATGPQDPARLWRDRALIWEAGEAYHYLRTTTDGRIIIGGGDEPFDEQDQRLDKAALKHEALRAMLAALWPRASTEAAYAWSGAFGETGDGLPLIGPVPGRRRIFAAYGYGGNGITFSFLASRMIGAMIAGETAAWHDDFALDRDKPG
ncbi:NAD(P)/FAD-dependent oxidoreductase [Phreatobacter stygius]|uniref:FAD-binding oxidoreductase n=1 Tax=Phreatobacter stygius TaxID=1940610 RepID=A0A4D7B655_9HYPH|nr:FAD-dependent oxidoreductase [Phreatobacter stygius]QCI68491.1 FAD-binding oxidoreductase [Phreatobacter stygius]